MLIMDARTVRQGTAVARESMLIELVAAADDEHQDCIAGDGSHADGRMLTELVVAVGAGC